MHGFTDYLLTKIYRIAVMRAYIQVLLLAEVSWLFLESVLVIYSVTSLVTFKMCNRYGGWGSD